MVSTTAAQNLEDVARGENGVASRDPSGGGKGSRPCKVPQSQDSRAERDAKRAAAIRTRTNVDIEDPIMEARKLNLWYGKNHALLDIDMKIRAKRVTALIGPSGCGKSTLIRTFNRMNDVIDCVRIKGQLRYKDQDIYGRSVDVMDVRTRIGMIFQKPNPFPKSIYDNIAYGPRVHGTRNRGELDAVVERSLRQAAIWDEVSDRLEDSAMGLSGGQQQRLCIARALAIEPEIILLDEPTSALDPMATAKIEDLVGELKKKYTVIIVTHNMQQAARVSDYTGFMYVGKLVEYGRTKQIFQNPEEELTENYITGRFG